MKQMTLAATNFERYRKTTRRETFLAEMDRIVPWRELCALIEPVYPKAGGGRPPIGLERMLRIHFLQHRRLSFAATSTSIAPSSAVRPVAFSFHPSGPSDR
jgi:hypothetical protein